jgi:O-antigen/teichoic acid export membrane protein
VNHQPARFSPLAGSLRARVICAGGWSFLGYALSQAIRFGTNLAMTRLLVPELYGVMSIALTVMIGLSLFADLGLRHTVIRSARGNDSAFLNTVWSIRIALGVCIALAAVLVAALLALAVGSGLIGTGSAYAVPELPLVIATLGAGAVVTCLESTKAYQASRELALRRLIQVNLIAQFVSVLFMLALAFVTRSVWVLVCGSLAATLTTTVLTHVWLPGQANRLQWERKTIEEVLGFGKWILASSVVGFLASALDKAILGVLVNATVLGVYFIAGVLVAAVDQVLSKLIGEVSYPALSEVSRERRHDLAKVLYRFHTPTAIAAYSAAGFLAAAAPHIVNFLYDDRYHDAGPMLQILSFCLVAIPGRLHAACLLSLGFSKIQFFLSVINLAVVAIAVPVGFHYFGFHGAVWGVVLGLVCSVPVTLSFSSQVGILNLSRELTVLPAWLAGLGLATLLLTALP